MYPYRHLWNRTHIQYWRFSIVLVFLTLPWCAREMYYVFATHSKLRTFRCSPQHRYVFRCWFGCWLKNPRSFAYPSMFFHLLENFAEENDFQSTDAAHRSLYERIRRSGFLMTISPLSRIDSLWRQSRKCRKIYRYGVKSPRVFADPPPQDATNAIWNEVDWCLV